MIDGCIGLEIITHTHTQHTTIIYTRVTQSHVLNLSRQQKTVYDCYIIIIKCYTPMGCSTKTRTASLYSHFFQLYVQSSVVVATLGIICWRKEVSGRLISTGEGVGQLQRMGEVLLGISGTHGWVWRWVGWRCASTKCIGWRGIRIGEWRRLWRNKRSPPRSSGGSSLTATGLNCWLSMPPLPRTWVWSVTRALLLLPDA